jgi:AAA ATPase domain
MLMGRTAECARIERALADARAGSSSVLFVRGEPGIGKSVLLQHAIERADGMNVLAARGIESEAEIPFAGLFELLRPALACLDWIPDQQAAALRGAFSLGPPAPASRFAIGAASLSLLAAYAEDTPVLVVVDDVHWIDASSADALAFATRRILAEHIAVLIAARTGESSPFDSAGLPLLDVPGLDADAARTLLVHEAGRAVPIETCNWLHRSTAGNPLALIELAAEAPRLGVELFDRPLAVETRVERAFARQIDQLSEAARSALVIVAAAGSLPLDSVARALQSSGLAPSVLEEAESARLLQIDDEAIEFRHPLMRSAAYHAAAPRERRAAHRALAKTLDAVRHADQRAWHLGSASLGPDAPAATALAEVAQRALDRSAYAAAAAAFGRAAQLTVGDNARSELLLSAADAAWLSGAAEQATRLLDEARQRNDRPRVRVEIEHLRARIALRQQPVMVSYEILVQAARDIAALDPAKAVLLLAEASGDALMYTARVPIMLETARWAWDLAQGVNNEEVSFFASMAFGQALIYDNHAEGATHVRNALATIESSATLWRNPRLVAWAGRGRLYLREHEGGAALLQRAVDAAREQGAIGMLPVALNQQGLDSATSDRWAAAHAQYAEGICIARELAQPTELCACLAGLCRLEAREGRADSCREHGAEALALADQCGMGLCRIWVHLALTQLELGLGHLEDALRHADDTSSVLQTHGVSDVDLSPTPELVETYVRLGRAPAAVPSVDEFYRRAEEKGMPWALARANRCRGLVADDASFERHFLEAFRCHDLTGDSFERGRSHLCFGERLRRARRRLHARRGRRGQNERGSSSWPPAKPRASAMAARSIGSPHRSSRSPRCWRMARPRARPPHGCS